MNQRLLQLLLISLFLLALPASAGGLSPWSFGMSKQQVSAFAAQGPYKSFANGDLETYNGVFDGHKENVQFFFGPEGLRRIGVYMYEGSDQQAAARAWRRAHAAMTSLFGPIQLRGIALRPDADTSIDELVLAVVLSTEASGKTQMAPATQPADAHIFSSFMRLQGKTGYAVIVYFDKPA